MRHVFIIFTLLIVFTLFLPLHEAQARRSDGMQEVAIIVTSSANDVTVGTNDVTVGTKRTYFIYVPSSYTRSRKAPLIIGLHGGGGTAEAFADTAQFNPLAASDGIIMVYPQGLGNGKGGTWNSGGPPDGYAEKNNIDDVGFIRDVIAKVRAEYSIDESRIYATGMSKGGMLSYRLACEMAPTFAAIAPVAATMTYAPCAPTSPVAVFHTHGTADENVPFEGGRGKDSNVNGDWPPVMNGIDGWRTIDGCDPGATVSSAGSPTRDSTCNEYPGCQRGTAVRYCLIKGGGHAWPGAPLNRWQINSGQKQSNFPTTTEIWSFFSAHPKHQEMRDR